MPSNHFKHQPTPEENPIPQDPPNPDVYAVQQEPEPIVSVPVTLAGPANVVPLPVRRMAAFTEICAATDGFHRIANGPDPKRAWVQLSADADILLSTTGNAGSGARLHYGAAGQGSPNKFETISDIYIAAVTGTVTVGVVIGYWAD